MKKLFGTLICMMTLINLANGQPQLSKDNIDEVLAAMTLEEKAHLVVGSGWGSMMGGSMTGSNETLVPGAAGTTQDISHLGIPATVLSDGPAGVRLNPKRRKTKQTYYATGFPIGSLLASTYRKIPACPKVSGLQHVSYILSFFLTLYLLQLY